MGYKATKSEGKTLATIDIHVTRTRPGSEAKARSRAAKTVEGRVRVEDRVMAMWLSFVGLRRELERRA